MPRPAQHLRRLTALLALSSAILVGCGDDADVTSGSSAGEPGTVRASDLPDSGTFEEWSRERYTAPQGREIDSSLPYCGDASEFVDTSDLDVTPVRQFGTITDSTTTIGVTVRGFTLVASDESTAEATFAAFDEEAFVACLAKSVDPTGADELGGATDTPDIGDETFSYQESLDDYVYFEGNDNSHEFSAYVTRVGTNVSVLQFIYSGQYFEDVEDDLEDLERDVVEAVAGRLG